MTNEEARKRLLDWIQYATDPERVPFMDEPCSDEEIILAMRIGADALSQLSLPSNIDEAAEEFGKKQGIELAPFAKKFFKRGAEWMAGRGVSMVITDETEWAEVDKFVHSNCDGASVIQIRKK